MIHSVLSKLTSSSAAPAAQAAVMRTLGHDATRLVLLVIAPTAATSKSGRLRTRSCGPTSLESLPKHLHATLTLRKMVRAMAHSKSKRSATDKMKPALQAEATGTTSNTRTVASRAEISIAAAEDALAGRPPITAILVPNRSSAPPPRSLLAAEVANTTNRRRRQASVTILT